MVIGFVAPQVIINVIISLLVFTLYKAKELLNVELTKVDCRARCQILELLAMSISWKENG